MGIIHTPTVVLKPSIEAPDGGVYYGRRLEALGEYGEAPYIAALTRHVGGVAEVSLPAGRADVASSTHIYEVEHVKTWRRGAQQAFAYAGATGLRPCLAVFGQDDYREIADIVYGDMPGLTLYWWAREEWSLIEPIKGLKSATRGVGERWQQRHEGKTNAMRHRRERGPLPVDPAPKS